MFGCPKSLSLPLVAWCVAAVAAPAAHAAGENEVRIALASPAKGKATPTFGGATLTVGRPAAATRSAITLRTSATPRLGATSQAVLGGSLTLRSGTRTLVLRSLRLTTTPRTTSLSGTVSGRRVTMLQSRTGATPRGPRLTLRRGALKLTAAGSRTMRSALRRSVRAGTTLGVISGTLTRTGTAPTTGATGGPAPSPAVTVPAPGPPPTPPAPTPPAPVPTPAPDPSPAPNAYTAPCLSQPGPLPAAGPGPALPALAPTHAVTSASTLTWGVRESWRWYLKNLGGTTAAWDGAALGPDVMSANGPAFGLYTFPGATTTGAYVQGATPTEDRAIVHLRGRVDFCHGTHGFRVTLSNLTVVIDGANSQVIADADTNHDGTLAPNQRVKIADLNLAGITPARTATTTTWAGVPAVFSTDGSAVFSGTGAGGGGSYPAGAAMDPLTVVAHLDTP